jgi:membrane fusion protein, multidrug efflux system
VIDGTGKLRPGSKIVEGKADTTPANEAPARVQG